MSTEVRVPTLGESVTEATVATWFKKAGEKVSVDEMLCELETDKVTVEVPSPATGTLSEIVAQEGETVGVDALLAQISEGERAEEGGDMPKTSESEARAEAKAESTTGASDEAGAEAKSKAKFEPKPKEKDEGKAEPEDKTAQDEVQTEAGSTEVKPRDPEDAPSARKMMEEQGLSADEVNGSGRDGRIMKEDVLKALSRPKEEAEAPQPVPRAPVAASDADREERVKMTRLRQTIARRLKEAQNAAAMLTTYNEVDMSAVMDIRNDYKDVFLKKHGVKLGFMSFFVKACCHALKEVPDVNAEIDGTDVVYKNYVHMGVAVGTPSGLVVPVVRDADAKSFAAIEKEIAELGLKARDGKLKMAEMQGGSFTISNGGVYGSLMSSPILNPPQSGILGMHKIQDRPMVEKGQIVVRPMMYLALSYDHRIVDGKGAVTFLVRVKEALEDPRRLLMDL